MNKLIDLGLNNYPSPTRLLLVTVSTIFLGEAVLMLLLDMFAFNPTLEAAIDALLLSVMMLPALFLLLYKPMVKHIQEQVSLQKDIQESEEKFRSISNGANDAIIMMDHEGRIVYWNKYAETMFGYLTEEVMNKDLHKTIAPHHYDEFFTGFENFKQSGTGAYIANTIETTTIRKDKTEVPVELSISSVRIKGKWCAIAIVRDIRQRKLAEEELKKYKNHLEELVNIQTIELQLTVQELKEEIAERKLIESELRSTQERLINQEKRAIIGELATGFAHEMRNQLNPIGFLEVIKHKLSTEEKEFVQYIFDARDRILSLIDDIRGLAKNEETQYEKSDIQLKEIIDEAVILIQMGCDVQEEVIHVEHGFDGNVNVNKDKIIQVLLNLIRNAAHALENTEGGKILIKTKKHENQVLIYVTDNGSGINESQVKQIWQPFYTTKGEKGTGVGLDICKRIVEGHNGLISCISQPNIETTFTISLPLDI